MKLRTVFTAGALIVGATIAVLLVVELASFIILRGYEASRKEPHLESPYKGIPWADTYWREFKLSGQMRYEPYTLWRRRAFVGNTISIDAKGLRRTTNVVCDQGAPVIYVLGDSTAWGTGSPDSESIPSRLAKHYQDSGKPVCVRNFAESGWVAGQGLIALIQQLKSAGERPSLVIYYGGSDTYVPYQSGEFDVHQNLTQMARRFESSGASAHGSFGYLAQTNTVTLLLRLAGGLGSRALNEQRFRQNVPDVEHTAREIVQTRARNIEVMAALANHYGFEYAFFWPPVIFIDDKPLSAEEQKIRADTSRGSPGLSELFQATYRVVREQSNPRLFYLGDAFRGQAGTMYIDWAHLTPEGNRLAADRVFEAVKNMPLKSMSSAKITGR